MILLEQVTLAAQDVVGADPGIKVTLGTVWFTFLISVVSPMVTGVITKRFADSQTKTVVLLFVTTLFTVLAQVGDGFELVPFLTQLVIAFFTAVGLHYQLLKPTGITGSQGFVNKVLPDFGVGKSYISADLPEAKGGPGDDRLDIDPSEVETGEDALLDRDDPNTF